MTYDWAKLNINWPYKLKLSDSLSRCTVFHINRNSCQFMKQNDKFCKDRKVLHGEIGVEIFKTLKITSFYGCM